MRYRVDRFVLEHLKDFDVRDEYSLELEVFRSSTDIQEVWCRRIQSFTLMYDNKPIMVFGFLNGGFGTYYPMVLASKDIDKHRFAVVRCMYKYVDQCTGSDLRRLEANVNIKDKPAMKFIEFFGFEPVGVRRNAAPDGNDQIIYERLCSK